MVRVDRKACVANCLADEFEENGLCYKCSDIHPKCNKCSNRKTCTNCADSLYITTSLISCSAACKADEFVLGNRCRFCKEFMSNCASCKNQYECNYCSNKMPL